MKFIKNIWDFLNPKTSFVGKQIPKINCQFCKTMLIAVAWGDGELSYHCNCRVLSLNVPNFKIVYQSTIDSFILKEIWYMASNFLIISKIENGMYFHQLSYDSDRVVINYLDYIFIKSNKNLSEMNYQEIDEWANRVISLT